VFDLRGNAGGLLEQAWQITDEFLPAGEMVVYTNSRHPSNNREYRATNGGTFEQAPVIVLVDENSASASEIVAGALQDHDRALIVGRRTFGKGLVQQQFPLSDGSVLQMTVSRYYTPSGRLIQTPYTNGEGEAAYFEAKQAIRDLMEGDGEGGLLDVSQFVDEVPDSLKFRTDAGRTVFGGGGILPDYLVRLDTLSDALQTIIGRNLDNEFARYRLEQLGDSFRQRWGGDADAFVRDYEVDDATLDAFLAWAGDHGVDVVETRPAVDPETPILVRSEVHAEREDVETRIKAFMARRLFDVDAFYPVVAGIDRTLQEAMTLWREASDLAEARPGR
jgi:carboxyl-terminal processing protease